MVGVELPVVLGGEGGEEGVLAGGEGELFDVLPVQRLAVQGDFPLEAVEAQDALHEGGLACAVLPEETHDLTPGNGQGDVFHGVLLAGIGFGDVGQSQHR